MAEAGEENEDIDWESDSDRENGDCAALFLFLFPPGDAGTVPEPGKNPGPDPAAAAAAAAAADRALFPPRISVSTSAPKAADEEASPRLSLPEPATSSAHCSSTRGAP